MARMALTYLLVLTLAAGPWLCCCTAALLASCGSAPLSEPACCGGAAETVPAEQPAVPVRSCPCQENRPTAAWLSAAAHLTFELDGLARSFLFTTDGLLLVHDCSNPTCTLPVSVESSIFPFSTGRDILRALHVLRC